MKIFITGATGFIGSYVIDRFARSNHEIYCLVRKTSNTSKLDRRNITTVHADLTNKKSFSRARSRTARVSDSENGASPLK